MRRLAAILLPLAACTLPLSPDGYRSIAPLDVYEVWWQEMEECSGLTRPFSSIAWYEMPNQDGVAGAYGDGRIFVTVRYLRSEWAVKHEILHALLDPVKGHPSPPYGVCLGDPLLGA